MNKKKIIIIIMTILILLMILLIISINNTNNDSGIEPQYFKMMDNGIKVNTSSKLSETKKIDGLEVTDLKLTELNNMTQLSGTITNMSNKDKGDYAISIVLLNSKGKEITTLGAYVKGLQPGESTDLKASTTLNYVNAYDIKLKKN